MSGLGFVEWLLLAGGAFVGMALACFAGAICAIMWSGLK